MSIRNQTIGILELIAFDAHQVQTRNILSEEELPIRLCHLWFDELYVPSKRYVDCLKGDRNEERLACFHEAFSKEELDALERFHRFFELRLEMLLKHPLKLAALPKSTAWQSTGKDARLALEAFECDPSELNLRQELVLRWLRTALPSEN